MNYGYDNLKVVMEQGGDVVKVLEDDSHVVNWVKNSFPLYEEGSINWTMVPFAKTASVSSHENSREIDAAFECMVEHVGGYEGEEVLVFWRDRNLPTISMPLWACRETLRWLLHVSPGTFVISLDRKWCLEADFHDHFYGARVE